MLQGQKKKDLRSPEWRPLTVPEEDASKEAEEKETDTDMKTPRWNRGPSAKTIVYTQSVKKNLELLMVSSYTQ